ncbi:MAG: hypothetical protein P8X80_04690, partial [Desulfobacterales bacterium]
RIRTLCQPVLPWSNKRWKEEIAMYLELWHHSHALPIQHSTSIRIKTFIPLATVGQWLYRAITKIWPKRWGSNPH